MKNHLFPIFLKASQLNILIVGGGKVALEKLQFLLKSSPNATVLVISKDFNQELLKFSNTHQVSIIRKGYCKEVLKNKQIVIAATDNRKINQQIYQDAKAKNILINVADTPDLCDFYLGGIVTKGNVKLAISTNGKSPTLAKRLRQFFEEFLPDNIDELAENLNTYRKTLKKDFQEKVTTLNKLTKGIIDKKD